MNDSIKGIFKILISIPVIIAISYLILNLFLFASTYFKMLGVSYSIMQIAMENNYIPENEKTQIEKYIEESIETEYITNVVIVAPDNNKKQYGTQVECGISGRFLWVKPFVRTVKGLDNTTVKTYGKLKGANAKGKALENQKHNINITYKVPGLKYYPDL